MRFIFSREGHGSGFYGKSGIRRGCKVFIRPGPGNGKRILESVWLAGKC